VKRCLFYTLAIVLLGSVGFSLGLFGQGPSTQHTDFSDQRVVATVGSTSITLRHAERNIAIGVPGILIAISTDLPVLLRRFNA
jgi:hypothetical protein